MCVRCLFVFVLFMLFVWVRGGLYCLIDVGVAWLFLVFVWFVFVFVCFLFLVG